MGFEAPPPLPSKENRYFVLMTEFGAMPGKWKHPHRRARERSGVNRQLCVCAFRKCRADQAALTLDGMNSMRSSTASLQWMESGAGKGAELQ
jgi:hypothetical protein